MTKTADDQIEEKLDEVIDLLRHLVAIELSRSGVNQGEIGKRLHVAKSTVGTMLRGMKKGKGINEREAA